jgi:deoxyribonuclease-4
LSCKGRTLKDGIEDVHNLGLTALEAQLVRAHVQERTAEPEEIGMTPVSLPNDMVIEIVRRKGTKQEVIYDLKEPIKAEDTLVGLSSGLAANYEDLRRLRVMADELDVSLSIHTPYYMDLVSDGELSFKSVDSIRWGGVIARELGGTVVVTHLGLYGDIDGKVAAKRIKAKIKDLSAWYKKQKIKASIGLELSGRQEIFGSLQEVAKLCKDVDGVVPVVNFAHYHAREGGKLREPKDFDTLLDTVGSYKGAEYYTHFSGVEHESGNEKRYTSIKKGDLRFEPLAESLVDRNDPITIVSGSPLLEHDAMYMKVILERVLSKKVSKEVKSTGNSKKEKAGSK